MTEAIRVLVVDDSTVVRRAVRDSLSKDPEIVVCATAANGKMALEQISECKPDVLILDIEMPEMDGFELLRHLARDHPMIRTIMFSSMTERGAAQTIDALSLGASDYASKPSGIRGEGYRSAILQVAAELIPKIKQFRPGPPRGGITVQELQSPPRGLGAPSASRAPLLPRIVAIGLSTGGPEALSKLLPAFPRSFPVPIVIVQHMPPLFTRLLSERLAACSALRVVEGTEGMVLEAGLACIVPGNFHATIRESAGKIVLALNQEPPENSCRPSADVLFRSVAGVCGSRALGVIMTGMGRDGFSGLRAMKGENAVIFAQDRETSVVWGMPSLVVREGLADAVLPLGRLSAAIAKFASNGVVANDC